MSRADLGELAALAAETGTTVHLVGGFLRDLLMERHPVDCDLLVEGDPTAFLRGLGERADSGPIPLGHPPATHRFLIDGAIVDVTSCGPDALAVDLSRRDFTVNALAARLVRGGRVTDDAIVDLHGGRSDLERGLIREVSEKGLEDDPLRLLRAVRLAVVLPGFDIAPRTREAIRRRAASITAVASERILAELTTILASRATGRALRMMAEVDLLTRVLPWLAPLDGLSQNRWHDHDVLEHTLRVVECVDELRPGRPEAGLSEPIRTGEILALKWAALLHDAGKAATRTTGPDGEARFLGHERESAAIARRELARLRLPRRTIAQVLPLIEHHLRPMQLASRPPATERSLRRLIHALGPSLRLLCHLAIADRRGAGGPGLEERLRALDDLIRRLTTMASRAEDDLTEVSPLIDGHDVMRILSIGPGPRVGRILRWLVRLQVDGRITTPEEAVALVSALPPARTPPG